MQSVSASALATGNGRNGVIGGEDERPKGKASSAWKAIGGVSRDKTTVEPVLRLLETLSGYNASYRRYDSATREEFDFYLKKWCGGVLR